MAPEYKPRIGFLRPNDVDFPGEKRFFLPKHIRQLAVAFNGIPIIHKDHEMPNFSKKAYSDLPEVVTRSSDQEIVNESDMIVSLKHPQDHLIDSMREGQVLVTMAHFHTRPNRVKTYREKGIRVVSMDSLVDSEGNRIVQDLKGVAWNGFKALFDFAEKNPEKYPILNNQLIKVLIMGTGGVGIHAVNAARYLGDRQRNSRLVKPVSVIVTSVGSDVTSNEKVLDQLLKTTDILVDATNRRDPTQPLIVNGRIALLPQHAAIVDLASDYYDPFVSSQRTMVKAVEGIPTGNDIQYVFEPDDVDFAKSIPPDVPQSEKRLTFSHGSWPALDPEGSMNTYGNQLIPLLVAMAGNANDPAVAYDTVSADNTDPRIQTLFTGTLTKFIRT